MATLSRTVTFDDSELGTIAALDAEATQALHSLLEIERARIDMDSPCAICDEWPKIRGPLVTARKLIGSVKKVWKPARKAHKLLARAIDVIDDCCDYDDSIGEG